jgi:hypothetical protein
MTLDFHKRLYRLTHFMGPLTEVERAELHEMKALLQLVQDEKDASWRRRVAQCKPGESPLCFSSE